MNEAERLHALLWPQVAVSAAHGEAVWFANSWSPMHRQAGPATGRVFHHAREHAKLLIVLFAEESVQRLREVKQPRHHLAHAAKVRGAKGIFKAWLDGNARYGPRSGLARGERVSTKRPRSGIRRAGRWVHRFDARHKDGLCARAFSHGKVGAERARVRGEVLRGRKLRWVDEDGRDHGHASERSSARNERGVAIMQRAHGGHQRATMKGR